MCCGIAGIVSSFIGSIVYALEKLTSIAAMTAIILCIVTTVTISLGLGVGLGYNYCFVAQKMVKIEESLTREDEVLGRRFAGTVLPFIPSDSMIVTTDTTTDTVAAVTTADATTESTEETPEDTTLDSTTYTQVRVRKDIRPFYNVNLTRSGQRSDFSYRMTIPLHGDFDFLSLLSKLRRRNKNVTLDLIT